MLFILCVLCALCGLTGCHQRQKVDASIPASPVIAEPNLAPASDEAKTQIYNLQKNFQLQIEQLRVSNQQWQAKFEASEKRLTAAEKSNGSTKKLLILAAGTGIAFLFFSPLRFLSIPLIAGSLFSLVVIQADNRFPIQIALIGIIFLSIILALVIYQFYLARRALSEIVLGKSQSAGTQKLVAKILNKNKPNTEA
jgi:hypothetical protein